MTRAVLGFLIYLFLVPALLFIGAGTMDWPMAWVYTALLLASTLGSRVIVLVRNPDTLRERARFTSAEGTKAWDRLLVAIVGLYGPTATMVVAGLDRRWGWSTAVPRPDRLPRPCWSPPAMASPCGPWSRTATFRPSPASRRTGDSRS